MLRPSLLFFGVLGLAIPSTLRADDPASKVFIASDMPDLARGFAVPRPGEYTVKAWTTGKLAWTLEVEGPALTLISKPENKDARPRWLTLGKATLAPETPATVAVYVDADRPDTPQGKEARTPKDQTPVPALLSFSTDPEFVPSTTLDLIRGRTNTVDPTSDRRRTVVRSNQEGSDFQPPDSPQAWRDRARAVREQLLVTLGLWPMPAKTELNPRVFGIMERDGYSIDKVVLETFPGFYLAGNLYRPASPKGRSPLVLCPHGHWEEGRVNVDVQSRCVRLAQLGCVVFLYDMVGYADSKPFGHAFLDDRLRRWGLGLPGLQTWNSIRAIDWLTSRADVDPTRIGITGESGGGTQTFLLTALDERIKVSAPVVMVSDSFQGGCACENGAGLRIGTDNVEFAALTAPRPLKMVGASGDWTARTLTNALPSIQVVYAHSGSTAHVEANVFDFPHNYNQTSRNAIYPFLAKWLLGNDDAESTREGTLKVEDPKDLYAFDADHPYPLDAKTPEQLETELIGSLGRQLDKLAPGPVADTWEAGRDRLLTALKVRVGLEMPAPRETLAREVRRNVREGLSSYHFVVGRRIKGESIPVVRLMPANSNGRLTVMFTARGKADLITAEGIPTPIARALLDKGHSIVGFDPLLIGESLDPSAPAIRRPSVLHFDTYNPTLAADRAQDLATVISWARALADVREVNLIAPGPAGPLALLARPALVGLSRTVIDLDGFDYGDGSTAVPAGLDLPGVLQFGGLKAAAALTAPSPLWVCGSPEAFDTGWPLKSYALADASPQLRLDRGTITAEAIAKWIDLGE